MFPPAPELGVLRLATLADIPRIAVVAASGFYHSSWFHYERPYYEKFPLDTLASYRNSYRNAISNKNAIVLVAEDTLNRSEKDSVYGALAESYPSFEEQIPDEHLKAGKAIVAVASFSLLPDSQRSGQFQPKDPEHYDPPDDPQDRDKDPLASDLMDKTLHPRETEAFKGRMVIDTMVTHPAYWRRGHATNITTWFTSLADMDHESVGVAGAPMGKTFFGKIGFNEVDTVEIPGYKAHPEPIYAWLGVREKRNGS